MFRFSLCAALVCLAGSGLGCRMCCAPFDYCGPVMEDCGNVCDFNYRSGSVLYGVPNAEVHYEDAGGYDDGGYYEDGYYSESPSEDQPALRPVPERANRVQYTRRPQMPTQLPKGL